MTTRPPPLPPLRPSKEGRTKWRVLRFGRTRRAPIAVALRPLRAVVLAIDSARKAGWAIYDRGSLVAYGECASGFAHQRDHVIDMALGYAGRAGLPTAIAVETPFGGPLATIVSLATSAALWRDTWRAHKEPLRACLDVQAGEWRRHLFGSGKMPRDAARRLERLTAQRIAHQHQPAIGLADIGPDAAAAICFGYVARSSVELQSALRCDLVETSKALRPVGAPRS